MSRAKRLVRAVGGGVFLCGLVVALLPGADPPGAPADRGSPTVPDRMAGYSYLTADVSSSPPGRGVALFQFGFGVEFLDFPQAVVVGADGDVYRRVDLAEDRAGAETQGDPAPMVLSPDGTKVAVGDHDRPEVAILDLTTGRVEVHPVRGGRSVLPVAWAPDSRRLAYLSNREATNPHAGPTPGASSVVGDVGLLDLVSGETAALEGASDVLTAAFAPDGRHIAVQRGGGGLDVLPVDGGTGRALAPRPGFGLAGPGAWSPDGALLAVWRTSGTCPDPGPAPCAAEEVVSFVDATGGAAPVPEPLVRGAVGPGRVLGWTASDRVAVLVPEPGQSNPDHHLLLDVPLDGAEPRLLSALPTSDARYGVSRFHVATALLPDLEVREAGDPDHGRWPLPLRLATALGAGALAAGASGLLLRGRRGGVVA